MSAKLRNTGSQVFLEKMRKQKEKERMGGVAWFVVLVIAVGILVLCSSVLKGAA